MVCLVCSRSGSGSLCGRCRQWLAPGGWRRLSGGLLVGSGFRHDGPARVLVHRLKYQGIRQAAGLLAEGMAPVMDGTVGTLVPVRRVLLRTWKYGIDPGRELASALAALTGLWAALPFLALFLGGYAYTAGSTLAQSARATAAVRS